ncbi:MAG: hypothetical protein NTZ05_09065, partial [Chloroflexi bacterium]|nr:hypothetical protein [Chloroflexota bacterium]
GFVTETVDELVEAALRLHEINPSDCRLHVEQNFSPMVMTGHYVDAYAKLVQFRTREAMAQYDADSAAKVLRFPTREAVGAAAGKELDSVL